MLRVKHTECMSRLPTLFYLICLECTFALKDYVQERSNQLILNSEGVAKSEF
jgi:hypothetical protein